jgi:glycosyltransferase involved in cell wall biosynthesis
MRIAFDLQACQTDSRDRGIGRYANNLACAMLAPSATQGPIDPIITLDGTDPERLRDARARLRTQHVQTPSAVYHYPASVHTDMDTLRADVAARLRGRFYQALAPDVFLQLSHFEGGTNYTTNISRYGSGPVASAVIAYDLIPLIYPEKYLPDGAYYTGWYREKCKTFQQFDRFLAISEATRVDLMQYLDIPAERIHVIGAGLDTSLLATVQSDRGLHNNVLKKHGIDMPFVLLVSNGDWRKNTIGAVEAFACLPAAIRNHHLLVLTQVGEDVNAALEGRLRHVAKRVRILGKVDDATLSTLYHHCAVFFFPSFYEGFGLPVLEAMAFGAPVLSSNMGSLPEVVQRAESLFDPHDKDASTALLARVLDDHEFQDRLRAGAAEHAQTFTWQRCAARAWNALSDLDSASPGHAMLSSFPRNQLLVEPTDIAVWTDFLEANPSESAELELGFRAVAGRGQRRILIDVSEVVRADARSGIQRVVRNFCIGLHALTQSGEFDLRLIQWTETGMRYANDYARNSLGLSVDGIDSYVEVRSNDLLLMLDSSWLAPERFDGFHAQIWKAGGEVVWMVYDLIPLLFPQTCDPGMPPAFRNWLSHAVATADGFVCISEATRQDLERFIDQSAGYIRRPWSRSVHLGSDLESGRAGAASATTLALIESLQGTRFFVAVGTVEPRKDYATILAAFDQLWAAGKQCALIVVGKHGWNVDELARKLRNHPNQGKTLFWLEGIGDDDLTQLLDHSSGLIQASLAEGFGLPVVEAGSRNIPLILSDLEVFHEVAGDAANYFPAGNADGLSDVLRNGLTKEFIKPVSGQVKAKTWRQVSADLAKVLLD